MTLDMSIAEAQLSADAAAATEASFEVLELVKNRGMKKVMHLTLSTVFTAYTMCTALYTSHVAVVAASTW
jgi:hypothetical protein